MDELVSVGGPRRRPLGAYATALTLFGTGLAGLLAWGLKRRRLPRRVSARDTLLLGVATHKIGQLIAKDRVTSPIRAPFVETEQTPSGEPIEMTAGTGARRVVGELVTCPYCLAPWVAGGLLATWALSPRAARTIATLFTAVAVSDFASRAYASLSASARGAGHDRRRGRRAGTRRRDEPLIELAADL